MTASLIRTTNLERSPASPLHQARANDDQRAGDPY